MTGPRTAEPVAELDPRYGEEGVPPTPWSAVREQLEAAELYWLSTVRPGGGPHVTPLIGVWSDGALHISTGPHEQKARNLAVSPRCALTTGRSELHGGTDVVLEGEAQRVTDRATLRRLAEAWEAKYGAEWHFDVGDGVFTHEGGEALVLRVEPATGYAFAKGPYAHTRYRFPRAKEATELA